MHRIPHIILAAVCFVLSFSVTSAFAGDDSQEIVTFPSFNDGGLTAGVHVISGRYDKRNVAIQCLGASTTGVHVRPVTVADGGQLARVTDVYVVSGKLYDTPTTGDKPYLAIRAIDAGAPTSCTIFLHRERGE